MRTREPVARPTALPPQPCGCAPSERSVQPPRAWSPRTRLCLLQARSGAGTPSRITHLRRGGVRVESESRWGYRAAPCLPCAEAAALGEGSRDLKSKKNRRESKTRPAGIRASECHVLPVSTREHNVASNGGEILTSLNLNPISRRTPAGELQYTEWFRTKKQDFLILCLMNTVRHGS